MKRSLLFSLVALLFILTMPSCKEDEYANWKIMNDNWLEKLKIEHKNDTNFFITKSGLCYKKIFQGNERFADKNSEVTVKYTGQTIDGEIFESGNFTFILNEMVDGFQEGVSKMQNGGHYILYIPSSIGFGTDKTKSAIPPNSTLIFDITLIKSLSVESY